MEQVENTWSHSKFPVVNVDLNQDINVLASNIQKLRAEMLVFNVIYVNENIMLSKDTEMGQIRLVYRNELFYTIQIYIDIHA